MSSVDPIRLGAAGVVVLNGPTVAGQTLEYPSSVNGTTVTVTGNVNLPAITAQTLTIVGNVATTTITTKDVTVKAGATLSHRAIAGNGTQSLTVNATGTVTVEATGAIDASGRGYPTGYSYPGVGVPGDRTGGSHVGYGGLAYGSLGAVFGSVYQPGEAGGGGSAANGFYQGSAGGGVVRIVAQAVGNDGSILANGWTSVNGTGAGGSIWIKTGALTGTGSIQVRGGEAGSGNGTGSGGAIAIEYTSASGSVLTNLLARGGNGAAGRLGGAGTIYVKGPTSTYGDLTVDNKGLSGQATELPSLGSGMLGAGTGATTLVTDRASSIPAYFMGHWVEVQDASANVKGTYRVSAIGADGKTLTVVPDIGVNYAPASGDKWYGIYRFDKATLANGITLKTSDFFRSGSLTLGTGAQVQSPRVTTGAVTAPGSEAAEAGTGESARELKRGDGKAPRIRFLTPYLSPEEVPPGADFVPSVEAFDRDGIASIEYFLDDGDSPCLVVDPALTAHVTRGCPIPNGEDGTVHRLRVRVTDRLGDTSLADAWLVIRDGVRIARKSQLITEDPAVVGRVVYVEGELLVEGRISVESLFVRAGGSIRPAFETDVQEGVEVAATGDIVVDAGGRISASGFGTGFGSVESGRRGGTEANPGTAGGGRIRLEGRRIVSSGLLDADGADSSASVPARLGLGSGGLVQLHAREGIFGPADAGGTGRFGVISARAGQPVDSEWGIPATSLGAGGEVVLSSPVVQIPGFHLRGSIAGGEGGHFGFVVVRDAAHPEGLRLDGSALQAEAEVGK